MEQGRFFRESHISRGDRNAIIKMLVDIFRRPEIPSATKIQAEKFRLALINKQKLSVEQVEELKILLVSIGTDEDLIRTYFPD